MEKGVITEQGAHGPYKQSERLALYKTYSDQLLKDGHAYHCFCTAERLDEMSPPAMDTVGPRDLDTLEGGWFRKTQQVPGGQQIQMTVLMTLALSVMASVSKLFAEDGVLELPFLHALGIPTRYQIGRAHV